MTQPTTRHKAREMALQILFQMEFLPHLDLNQAIELYRQHLLNSDQEFEYCAQLVTGVREQREAIDALVQSHSQNWKLNRMSMVDLNILRIATLEIRFAANPLPPRVAIDEAIELAKHYGSTDSSAFVNGVLDRLAQKELS